MRYALCDSLLPEHGAYDNEKKYIENHEEFNLLNTSLVKQPP